MSIVITSVLGRLGKCSVAFTAALGALIGLSQNAQAVTTEYSLEGYLNAPIFAERTHSTVNTHYTFQQHIDKGDLILSYNDNNTADKSDDVVRITGTTDGGICRSGDCRRGREFGGRGTKYGFRANRTDDGVFFGSGTFEWDLVFANPLMDTSGAGDFSFGAQDAGSISLVGTNRNRFIPKTIDVSLKEHPDLGYAFKLNPNGEKFDISSWILNEGGVIFGHARAESLRNEAVFNFDITAHCISGACAPGTEVPEPMTMGLLGAGLLGGVAVRRRKEAASE